METMVDAKMWEADDFKCKHCGVTPPKGHWRPFTWLEKHEANCPNNPVLKEVPTRWGN